MNLKKLKNLFKYKHVAVVVLLVVIFIELISYFHLNSVTTQADIENYANKVLTLCKDTKYHPACYDKAIPQLMDYISMEDAFKVTSIVQDKDRSYLYCHVLAHALSAREVDKNPSAWKDVVSRVPSGMCSNGGIHGAFQERFRGETFTEEQLQTIKPELNDLCEERDSWHPTGLEQASCYHALGHLTMYLTSADIPRSLSLCDEISLKPGGRDYRHLCYDGAFMQIFQPLEAEDFSLIIGKEVTKEQLPDFCNKFTGEVKGSCWSEGWPLYRSELEKPEGLNSYCSKASLSERDRCFSSIIYVMTAMFNLDSNKIISYCPKVVKNQVGGCFASGASRMIEVDYRNIDKAAELCTEAEKFDPKHTCFKTLLQYSTYNFKKDSPEFYKVCNSMPTEWKELCLKKQ
ncbi:hypothetical protein H0W91_02145 [Patescibacteria group bacterium]|nr:hypothetical protein [Patescibacteria group bacterium]